MQANKVCNKASEARAIEYALAYAQFAIDSGLDPVATIVEHQGRIS